MPNLALAQPSGETRMIANPSDNEGQMKVGDTFKLFGKGVTCKVTKTTSNKIRFETASGMIGSFPMDRIAEHLPSDNGKKKSGKKS